MRHLSRRRILTSAAALAASIAAPYVRGAHAAGKLTLGLANHWVPGANDTMSRIIGEWGAKNKGTGLTLQLRQGD